MLNKNSIVDLFRRQWPRIERADIDNIVQDTGGISAFECVLMYLFILDRAPRYSIEFSPNHGYSTQAIAMALRVLGCKDRFGTFEIKPNLCESTTKRMERLGLTQYVEVVRGDALKNIPEWIKDKNAKVDFVFIDSDHTEGFANKYIQKLFPIFEPNALLGVHDICAHKKDDSGQTSFKTSLGKGSKKGGEEKPIERHLTGKKFSVLHAITGGKHEGADLSWNAPLFEELLKITGVDFRKLKCKACPKSVFFFNSEVEAVKPDIVLPKTKPAIVPTDNQQYLFILAMNDSGSTFLQNVLSHCQNCISFRHPKHRKHGLEGQGASYWRKKNKGWYPRDIDHGVVKVFSEKAQIWEESKHFNWKEVRTAWTHIWSQNPHNGSANPKVFLEKTPSSLYSVEMYEKQFPGCRFLIMQRNPYVVCEGIRRTIKQHKKKDYTLARCVEHWVACTLRQIENIKRLTANGTAMWFKYEELVTRTGEVQKRIINFVPAFHDLDLMLPSTCHSMDGNKAQPLTNYNNKQLKKLSPDDYAQINSVLEKHRDIMKFFAYQIRSEAP